MIGPWRMARTPAGAFASPPGGDVEWLSAAVPGTVAGTLRKSGRFDGTMPEPLDGDDFWYSAEIEGRGSFRLVCHGLATIADVYLDGARIGASQSMYAPLDIPVQLSGRYRIDICFRALAPLLEQKRGRARWRPRMVTPATLRGFRTTFLGRMPGWCPPVHAIGPFRDIELISADTAFDVLDFHPSYDGEAGRLAVRVAADGAASIRLRCAGRETELAKDGRVFRGDLRLPGVKPWWPHTHGEPCLHHVSLVVDGVEHSIGRTGFRKVEILRGDDGRDFGVRVNNQDVFCRGACWTIADIVDLPDSRASCEPLLRRAQQAHMNMIRVGGTMLYESDAFYDLCDELGLLVWQDFMLANFDYPAADPQWRDLVSLEARHFLRRTRMSPALALFCGGSEVWQQAAMFGLPQSVWSNAIFDRDLRDLVEQERPDAVYIANTPFGGSMPFEARSGVTHYYGVSAYRRPLRDARDAGVRFAAESLGFAHVPAYDVALEPERGAVVQPCWGERHEGDVGAIWFFEDVRNHYLAELYGVDPDALRRDDPQRYLDLSRAITIDIYEDVFASWRRHGSCTRGGLIWFLKDVTPGAGWGLLDHTGDPKPVWNGIDRAFQPVTAILTDEGLNGLDVTLINETASPRDVTLTMTCLRDGQTTVMRADRDVTLKPRDRIAIPATDLWGAFFDTAYAYRFGPPSHDVTVARLTDRSTGEVLSDAFHFPLGRDVTPQDLGLAAEAVCDGDGWKLRVSTQRFARHVHVEDDHFDCAGHWRHVAPGAPVILRLSPKAGCESRRPSGLIRAVNADRPVSYGAD